jgi:hypothetical protein
LFWEQWPRSNWPDEFLLGRRSSKKIQVFKKFGFVLSLKDVVSVPRGRRSAFGEEQICFGKLKRRIL